MNAMPMMTPATTALMTVAMMIAMMLPSFAPSLWRYHRTLNTPRAPRVSQRTALFAAGYGTVWIAIGLALFAMSVAISPAGIASPADAQFASWGVGATLLCAGMLQRSRWKAKHLLYCVRVCAPAHSATANVRTAWRDGLRLGVHCGLSCAAPMVVLFVAGLMDARAMLVITAAITAERVVPNGAHVARVSGALALIAGVIVCGASLS
ncbi:MAG TPA: DUF2182 domain-containing protein [Gemmatimonadaceae bacterium]|jgi:predicted metal-binding membrane protein